MLSKFPARHVFFIGIGGIGVSGLAELLHQQGVTVSGSDVSKNNLTKRLQSLGITVFHQHEASNIADADLIVFSSAITPANPERAAAEKAGIRLLTRGQLLAEVTRSYCSIIVAGTHGKTTTSGMIAWMFETAKQDPTFMIGGVLCDRHSPMQLGKSRYFIAESDESDASFLFLSPTVAIITNIDEDHMETYEYDFERLKQSFLQFVQSIPSDGFVIACIDDPVVRALIPKIKSRVITYGESDDANYCLTEFKQDGLQSDFVIRSSQRAARRFTLNCAGKHNALNSITAIITADEFHLSDKDVQTALKTFPGMKRRLQSHGEMSVKNGTALLFDDYGHHPAELRATLAAAKLAWPDRRVILVFQPHRYTRTRDLFADFVAVLKTADQLVLTEIYAASEEKIPGIDGDTLFHAIKKAGATDPVFISQLTELPDVLQKIAKPNDVIILQGAGNIVTMADILLSR